jgi:hypothetical protein
MHEIRSFVSKSMTAMSPVFVHKIDHFTVSHVEEIPCKGIQLIYYIKSHHLYKHKANHSETFA